MSSGGDGKEAKVRMFWEAYRTCVEEHSVAPFRAQFYLGWVQEFVEFLPGIKLRERSAQDIEAFLKFIGEQAGKADWQARWALRLLDKEFLLLTS